MYIIAEVGSNFECDKDIFDSIEEATIAGADAVKFQLYTHEDLYGYPGEIKSVLNPELLPKISKKCKEVGIDFICTVFHESKVQLIAPYVDAFKIASAECNYEPLLIETVTRAAKKKIYISVGACDMKDLFELDIYTRVEDYNITIMYCPVAYPSRYCDVRRIKKLKEVFPCCDIGFSDHTIDVYNAPLLAKALGAKCIEKHFKIRDMNTPDNAHSLTSDEFKHFCHALKVSDYTQLGPTPEENNFYKFTKRTTEYRIKCT